MLVVWQPNSLDSSQGLRPLRISSTICWRNPGEYGGFVLGISDSSVLFESVREMGSTSLQAIRAELMRRRHESVAIMGKWLNRVVQGYFNYHAVPGNLYRLAGLRSEIGRAWRHALMRRSQRHRLTWDRFSRIVKRFIPPVRNTHPYPEERFYASHT